MRPMGMWITRRRYSRTAYDGKARYQVDRENGGHAVICDVDQGGLCLRVDHPLRQGQRIVVDVEAPRAGFGSMEFLGKVAWCRPVAGGYRVGIRVFADDHDVKIALTELVCAGLKRVAGIHAMRNRHFVLVEYGRRGSDLDAVARPSVWKQFAPQGVWKPSAAVNLGF